MEISETLFRRWIRYRQRRLNDARNPEAVTLGEVSSRLSVLASMITGQTVEVKADAGIETRTGALLLPATIDFCATRDHNTEAYLYRTAFMCCTDALDLNKEPVYIDALHRQLILLCAVPQMLHTMCLRFPALGSMSELLHNAALSSRSPVTRPRTVEAALETLIQTLLGRRAANDSPCAWLIETAARKHCGSALLETAERLRQQLLTAYPRPRFKLSPDMKIPLWELYFPAEPTREAKEHSQVKPRRRTQPEHTIESATSVKLKRRPDQEKPNNPIFHSFEKTETIEDYAGERQSPETASDLTADQDALHDLKLGHVVRSAEETPGLLKVDALTDGLEWLVEEEPAAPRSFSYPEWNWKKRHYRENWCKVIEERPKRGELNLPALRQISARNKLQLQQIRLEILRRLTERRSNNRQPEGPEVDIDSLIERYGDLAAGHTPPTRLYFAERKVLKDVAMLLLFDTSLSTDGYVENRRVLDIEMETIVILAEAFEGYFDDEVAVAHFNSRTRNDCRVQVLKDFGENWNRLRSTVLTLEPSGFTRIGPAIRHGIKLLRETKAKHRYLLLISDGKPTDYDQYEGRYGIEDVAQAIREGTQSGVTTFALAIEKEAKRHLSKMLGPGGYKILPRTTLLPSSIADLLVRILD